MCEMELNDSFSSSSSDLNFMENSLLSLVVHCQTGPELQVWFEDLEVGKLALTCHFAYCQAVLGFACEIPFLQGTSESCSY